MRKIAKKILLVVALSGIFIITSYLQPANAGQDIKETAIISKFLGENFAYIKRILRHSREMQEQARPFSKKRHLDRYRFEPGEEHPREIMILVRKISARFKMINGILYHAQVSNIQLLYKEILVCSESITTSSKRAIRANRDNNYALYLASAQGIEEDIYVMNDILNDFEQSINASIYESDLLKETL